MLVDALVLASGLLVLLPSGEALVRGSAALARRLGVPPLVIGLTVVAFGTSAPELAVNVTAAIAGDGAVSFGNIVGSNLANVGLVLALCALIRPLAVQSIVITREIPMMLLASGAALVMGIDALRGVDLSTFDRADGLLLLLLFAVFMYYTVTETIRGRTGDDPLVEQARHHPAGERLPSALASGALVIAGLIGLGAGGRLTVLGAIDVASALGAPEALIGLTIIALGTSLPELVAGIVAVRRGEVDLAVGNVVGSNIFNLLFVLGVTGAIRPVPVPSLGAIDLVAMVGFGATLLFFAFGRSEVTRTEGACLLAAYVAYIGWRI